MPGPNTPNARKKKNAAKLRAKHITHQEERSQPPSDIDREPQSSSPPSIPPSPLVPPLINLDYHDSDPPPADILVPQPIAYVDEWPVEEPKYTQEEVDPKSPPREPSLSPIPSPSTPPDYHYPAPVLPPLSPPPIPDAYNEQPAPPSPSSLSASPPPKDKALSPLIHDADLGAGVSLRLWEDGAPRPERIPNFDIESEMDREADGLRPSVAKSPKRDASGVAMGRRRMVAEDGDMRVTDEGRVVDAVPAHTRSPVLARPPSMLESLSRTVRGYVPSSVSMSIPVPSAAPSPPLVSRPVSFGSFLGQGQGQGQGGVQRDQGAQGQRDQGTSPPPQRTEGEYRRNRGGQDGYGYGYGRGYEHPRDDLGYEDARRPYADTDTYERNQRTAGKRTFGAGQGQDPDTVYARDVYTQSSRPTTTTTYGAGAPSGLATTYPRSPSSVSGGVGGGVGGGAGGVGGWGGGGGASGYDAIAWSRWDVLGDRRLLILGYASPGGLQIWDCTDLGSIRELLNLGKPDDAGYGHGPSAATRAQQASSEGGDDSDVVAWGAVTYAAVLPAPPPHAVAEDALGAQRPLIGVVTTIDDESVLVVYSLRSHRVVRRLAYNGLLNFQANGKFIVLATQSPPTLHILSSATLSLLTTVSSTSLAAFVPSSSSSSSSAFNVLPSHRTSVSVPHIDINNNHNNDYTHNNSNFNTTNINASITSNASYTQNYYNNNIINTNNASSGNGSGSAGGARREPYPVYALSGRLLAYASPAPRMADTLYGSATTPAARRTSAASTSLSVFAANVTGGGGAGGSGASGGVEPGSAGGSTASTAAAAAAALVQAELGSAARKVGGSMLSGMKSLGGMAYAAALSKAGLTVASPGGGVVGAGSGSTGGGGAGGGGGVGVGGAANRFFSRSAPAATASPSEAGRGRRYSMASAAGGEESGSGDSVGASPGSGQRREGVVEPVTGGAQERGYFVTVVDLAPLLPAANGGTGAQGVRKGQGLTSRESSAPAPAPSLVPTVISEFQASRHQRIAGLHFSADGSEVLVVPKDGQTVQTFRIRPVPASRRTLWARIQAGEDKAAAAAASSSPSAKGVANTTGSPGAPLSGPSSTAPHVSGIAPQEPPLHVYDLRRGRTSAVVEGVEWTADGRWVAFGTWNRTVHVFPVNPYGGKPDVRSHLEGVVRNVADVQPLSVEVKALARLHVGKGIAPGQPKLPLTFTFLHASDPIPNNLRFAPATSPPQSVMRYGSAGSSNAGTDYADPLASPRRAAASVGRGPGNFQDVLMFDPMDGALVLQRIVVAAERGDGKLPTPVQQSLNALGMTSRSAPRMGGAGPLASSPPRGGAGAGGEGSGSGPRARALSGLSRMMDAAPSLIASGQGEERLVGKDTQVAYWNLRRSRDWGEVRRPVGEEAKARPGQARRPSADWHAQAELTTHSKSRGLLHRSIYLSHQFSFHTLGEDYHALIRRFKFDIGGAKIEFRKEVEASLATGGGGESFVEGFAGPSGIRRASSSFDEPLASALAGGLDYASPPPVLPMLPNGAPGSNPKSFRNSIPIRVLSDNVSEGFGRIRREIQGRRVRSPRLAQGSAMGSSVPLEFDEEDEDFLLPEQHGGDERSGRSASVASRSRGTSRGGAGSSATVSTPATSARALDEDGRGDVAAVVGGDDDEDEMWGRWENEDRLAVEEAERFDDISVVGFLDEEMRETKTQPQTQRGAVKGRTRARKVAR
ncbi:hypothetical protein HGRIS_008904 [Hohenbuehelia grisea]|uniref:BCAS3 WD40 domain-containing protein n=1 Tax=Hohenbuehelia grisea TaxID=104357 RepID=A0ABR3IZN0_9AGAR